MSKSKTACVLLFKKGVPGMTKPWTEFVRDRITHVEKNTPWWVNNKVTLGRFCADNDLPSPTVFKVWTDPSEIDFTGLPERFVLKPNIMSSSSGVMVLARQEDGTYYESLSKQTLTMDEIIVEQNRCLDKATYKKSFRVFAEEIVVDARNPQLVPADYKVYCFYDKPILVQQIDRNINPTGTAFFDGEFQPLDLAGKIESEWKHYQLIEPILPGTAQSMLSLASEVTKLIRTPFMRIDLYNSTRGALIGELTPAPGGPYHGKLYKFTEEYDVKLGGEWEDALKRIAEDSKQ